MHHIFVCANQGRSMDSRSKNACQEIGHTEPRISEDVGIFMGKKGNAYGFFFRDQLQGYVTESLWLACERACLYGLANTCLVGLTLENGDASDEGESHVVPLQDCTFAKNMRARSRLLWRYQSQKIASFLPSGPLASLASGLLFFAYRLPTFCTLVKREKKKDL